MKMLSIEQLPKEEQKLLSAASQDNKLAMSFQLDPYQQKSSSSIFAVLTSPHLQTLKKVFPHCRQPRMCSLDNKNAVFHVLANLLLQMVFREDREGNTLLLDQIKCSLFSQTDLTRITNSTLAPLGNVAMKGYMVGFFQALNRCMSHNIDAILAKNQPALEIMTLFFRTILLNLKMEGAQDYSRSLDVEEVVETLCDFLDISCNSNKNVMMFNEDGMFLMTSNRFLIFGKDYENDVHHDLSIQPDLNLIQSKDVDLLNCLMDEEIENKSFEKNQGTPSFKDITGDQLNFGKHRRKESDRVYAEMANIVNDIDEENEFQHPDEQETPMLGGSENFQFQPTSNQLQLYPDQNQEQQSQDDQEDFSNLRFSEGISALELNRQIIVDQIKQDVSNRHCNDDSGFHSKRSIHSKSSRSNSRNPRPKPNQKKQIKKTEEEIKFTNQKLIKLHSEKQLGLMADSQETYSQFDSPKDLDKNSSSFCDCSSTKKKTNMIKSNVYTLSVNPENGLSQKPKERPNRPKMATEHLIIQKKLDFSKKMNEKPVQRKMTQQTVIEGKLDYKETLRLEREKRREKILEMQRQSMILKGNKKTNLKLNMNPNTGVPKEHMAQSQFISPSNRQIHTQPSMLPVSNIRSFPVSPTFATERQSQLPLSPPFFSSTTHHEQFRPIATGYNPVNPVNFNFRENNNQYPAYIPVVRVPPKNW